MIIAALSTQLDEIAIIESTKPKYASEYIYYASTTKEPNSISLVTIEEIKEFLNNKDTLVLGCFSNLETLKQNYPEYLL